MPKTVQEGFSELVGRLIPTNAQRSSGASHRSSIEATLRANFGIRSLFESGSFSHGTGVRGFSDTDLFVDLNEIQPLSSYTALDWIKQVLDRRYSLTVVSISRPAIVVKFGSGYEKWEIIPAFRTSRMVNGYYIYEMPDPGSQNGWIESAPKVHLSYVNECNKVPNTGNAKELARLIKAWKYFCQVPVSSFYLEMQAARYMCRQSTYIPIYDLCYLLEELSSSGLGSMNDPSGATGRFHPCSSTYTLEIARSKTSTAATRARKALEAHKANNSIDTFHYLDLLFGGNFPARY